MFELKQNDFVTIVICIVYVSFLQRSWGIQMHVYVTDFQMWYSRKRDFKQKKKLFIKIETYNLKIIFIGQVEFRNNIKILDWKIDSE